MALMGITNQENDALVDFAKQTRIFLGEQLQDIHTKTAGFWRRYFTKRDDPRGPTEQWRSLIAVPQVYYDTEAKAAQLLEMIMSADPPIQPDPIFETAEAETKSISNLLDYTQRTNYLRSRFLSPTLRSISVQGTEFYKNTWKKRTVQVPNRMTIEQIKEFQKRVEEAGQVLAVPAAAIPSWMSDPQHFEEWRQLVNKANRGVTIPSAPDLSGLPKEVTTFWGPYIERLPFWNIFADPLIQEMADQPIVIHEMYKPRDWLLTMTGDEPTKPYDPVRVAKAMSKWSGDTYSVDQAEVTRTLDIPNQVQQNPQIIDAVKVWEVWRPNSQFPFQVILNEEQVINKNPRVNPFEHGGIPIGVVRNVLIGGYLYGISDVDPVVSLVDEQDTLRSLRMDKVTLHTLPVFQKLQSFGIPDLQKKFKPGGIIEVPRIDGIKELITGDINPSAFAESDRVSLDIDRGYGIGDNVRGGQSTVNRTSATEQSSRLTQALTRLKMNAVQIEDDLNYGISQWLSLWAQYGTVENRPTIGGHDPLAGLDRDRLLVAMAQNYRLRGATQAVNRDLQAQQLMMFGDKFGAMMLPDELRALMRETAMALGLRSISKIVTTQGDQIKMQEYQQQAQMAQAQAQGQTGAAQAQDAAQKAPSEVPVQ